MPISKFLRRLGVLRSRRPAALSRRVRLCLEVLEDRITPSVFAPTYTLSLNDAVTADNEFVLQNGKHFWTVDAGADDYQNDDYERPTAQTYKIRTIAGGEQRFATDEYFANLDIVSAQAGYDSQFLYVSIKLAGLGKHTTDGEVSQEGLIYRYGFRIGRADDGGGGHLIVADQPGLKNSADYGGAGTFIYQDVNGDVGGTGRSVTKQDLNTEVDGNGYESVLASDGMIGGNQVLWARISPTDPTTVEFVIDYQALGYTTAEMGTLPYLEFEANKGPQDPQNYSWNDQYTKSEAGSPYRATSGNPAMSEFGTQGLVNIYELDTLRGTFIPPPVSAEPVTLSGNVYDLSSAVPNVVVTLTGVNDLGDAITLTTTTDVDGHYVFEGLRPSGSAGYRVSITVPPFYFASHDIAGIVLSDVPERQEEDTLAGDPTAIGGIDLFAGDDGVEFNFILRRIQE